MSKRKRSEEVGGNRERAAQKEGISTKRKRSETTAEDEKAGDKSSKKVKSKHEGQLHRQRAKGEKGKSTTKKHSVENHESKPEKSSAQDTRSGLLDLHSERAKAQAEKEARREGLGAEEKPKNARSGHEKQSRRQEREGREAAPPAGEPNGMKIKKPKPERSQTNGKKSKNAKVTSIADGETRVKERQDKEDAAAPVKDLRLEEQMRATPKRKRKGQSTSKIDSRKQRQQQPLEISDGSWKVVPAVGGLQLDLDPVFSPDEEYLLLAYHDSIRIYARSTSLKVRSLKTRRKAEVSRFHLSYYDQSQLYVSYEDGHVQLWNWKDGALVQSWDVKSRILGSACSSISLDTNEALFTVDELNGKWMITAHQLQGTRGIETSSLKTLYRLQYPISRLCVLADAHFIVVTGRERMVIGYRQDKASDVKSLNYKWWEFSAPREVASLDARAYASLTEEPRPLLDLAIGCQDGTIHVYSDIVTKLTEIEQSKRIRDPPNAVLHWHRNAVSSVRWSKDGNYLISGGAETVLVLWQLDTGGKSFLPHLSASIDSIVVSPTGTLYAIGLADNSCMVVSTQELKPIMNVPDVILPATANKEVANAIALGRLQRPTYSRRVAVAASRASPPQIHMAVPGLASFDREPKPSRSATYLQTIDARSGAQVARQALTRTKITDRNTGPEGFVLDDPDVVLLQISNDGKWLASVEEWSPPVQDLDQIEVNGIGAQPRRLETCLRLWSWGEEASRWELVTRVDRPHASNESNAYGIVLDLIPDPSQGFVTLGDDRTVRTWKPKPRYRDNIPVKDTQGRSLMNWSRRQTVHLPPTVRIHPSSSRIAMSQDGSILVVGEWGEDPIVYTIDMRSSHVLSVRTDLFTGPLTDLAILRRSLIVLADQLLVWDLVDDRLDWAVDLGDFALKHEIPHSTHLSVDPQSGTFMIALPEERRRRGPRTRAAVFDVSSSKPSFVTEVRQMVVALVSARKGFYAVDRVAQIHAILPSSKETPQEPEPAAEGSKDELPERGIEAIYGSKLTKDESRQTDHVQQELNIIRQHQLSELFGYTQPFALPPVTKLFEQVASLITGKAE